MKPRKMNGFNEVDEEEELAAPEDGVDLYNYDEDPSEEEGELEDEDDEDQDLGLRQQSGHSAGGQTIELKAKIDTDDDDEFGGGDHGRVEGPRTPPVKRERSTSPRSSKKSSKSAKYEHSTTSSSNSSTYSSMKTKDKYSISSPEVGELDDSQMKKSSKKHHHHKDSSKRKRTSESACSNGGADSALAYDAEYFKRMAARSKDVFHDPTDRELFIENLWKNIKGRELALCSHKYSTDCLIWLLEHLRNNSTLRKITEGLNADRLTAEALTDESVSSVIEALVEALIRVLTEEEEKEYDTSTARWCIKYLDGLAKLIEEGIVTLLADVNGCRTVIVVMEAVGGIRIGRHWSRQNMRFGSGIRVNLQAEIEKDISFKELPSPFKHHLKRFAKCLVLDLPEDDIKDLLFGRATQVAQYLLFILKVRYPELCQMVVKRLVEIVFDRREEDREVITQSASSAYIIEIIMMVASETRLSKIWTKYLKGHLETMWRHDIANFIVQRLIDAIKDENLFADVCAEIFPCLDEIFKCNRAGIGVCLAKACQEFKKMQHELINALLKAYHCYEPKEKQLDLVPSLLFIELKFPPAPTATAGRFGAPPHHRASQFDAHSKIQIWLHGSLMLQYIMSFENPSKACRSLLSLSTDDIIRIAKDRSGSHVIDAFIHGTNVPLKHKSELVERFLGRYHDLSLDKFGSRIVENIISLSDHQVKRAIMDELSQHEATLTSNRNGWFVARKVGLSTFKHRPGDWRSVEQNRERKKRVFSEFLSGPLGPNRGQGPSGHFAGTTAFNANMRRGGGRGGY